MYGGQDYQVQFRALDRGVHVVVGTPGRVMDHIRRGSLKLDGLCGLVLDEADEMLRMGFIDDVREENVSPFDWTGFVLSSVGLCGTLFGLDALTTHHEIDPVYVGALVAGIVVAILVFTRRLSMHSYVPYGPFLIGGALWAILVLATVSNP